MVQPRIRVMIVDDHEMVRNSLTILLEAFDDLGLVGTATNGQEAIQLCDRIETDVVLMDLVMPRMDGITAMRMLRQHHPRIQFVALISFGDEELLEEVMEAGAASYVLKSAPIDQVARAIRHAARTRSPQPGMTPGDISPVLPNRESSGNGNHDAEVLHHESKVA